MEITTNQDNNQTTTLTGYYPTYQYTYNGQQYTDKEAVGQARERIKIGDTVDLYVDPNNPSSAITDKFKNRYLLLVLYFLPLEFSDHY